MSITTSLSDSLPSSIPKLDASGLNWAIFSVCFQDAIEAKGFWSHFDGTSSEFSVLEDSVLYTWTLQKNGSASICAVIAGRSTKTRDFDNEIENHRNQNYLLECTICNNLHPKKWVAQLVDNLSCFSQSELGPAMLKALAHLNQFLSICCSG